MLEELHDHWLIVTKFTTKTAEYIMNLMVDGMISNDKRCEGYMKATPDWGPDEAVEWLHDIIEGSFVLDFRLVEEDKSVNPILRYILD